MSPDQARSKERKYLTTFVRRLEKVLEELIDERDDEDGDADETPDAVKASMRELCEQAAANGAALSRVLAAARKQTKNLRVMRPLKALQLVPVVKGFMGKHYNVRYSFILWFRFRFQCGFSFNFWFRFHVSALSLSLSLSPSLPPSLCVCVCGRVCVQWKQAMENYHEAWAFMLFNFYNPFVLIGDIEWGCPAKPAGIKDMPAVEADLKNIEAAIVPEQEGVLLCADAFIFLVKSYIVVFVKKVGEGVT